VVDLAEAVVVEDLGGSSRSVVQRVRLGDRTLVVKRFTGDPGGFPREAAALSVLPGHAPVPALVDVGEEPPTIVLSDEGAGPSVADALLGDDPEPARRSVLSWAEAVARLHDASVGLGDEFRAALAARCDQAVSTVAADIDWTVETIGRHAAELGVTIPGRVWDGLRARAERLEGGPVALSPGDTCPDNNVATPRGRVLLDFENAQWRHPAWDVSYLVVPWPTCWCSWRMPDDVAERALRRYREVSALPWARSDDFDGDVQAAAAAWAYVTTALFLERALGDDPPPADPRKRMPARRAMILHRLAAAGDRELRDALTARWGEIDLPYAPAFRTA
jgi:hypothetical protein